MSEIPSNDTRERILETAEALFSQRGYASVKLRDIAAAVGMRHASLYYYAPGGKEQLFIEVMERNFHRHREGLTRAIAGAGENLHEQMHAVSDWLVSQPPLDFMRMAHSDMPAIDSAHAERLSAMALEALSGPIMEALERAYTKGQIEVYDFGGAAMALVGLVQTVHSIPERYLEADGVTHRELGHRMTDMLLYGWVRR